MTNDPSPPRPPHRKAAGGDPAPGEGCSGAQVVPVPARPMTAGGQRIPQAALDLVRHLIARANYPFATADVANVLINHGVEPFAATYAADRLVQQERRAGRIWWSRKDRRWLVVKGNAA
jgi:hypothetical protein